LNKKVIAGVITALCLAVPFGVSAATTSTQQPKHGNMPGRVDTSKLNDTQKADLKAQLEKMIQLKKETVQKMIDNGSITKEQGDEMLKKLDERLSKIKEGNLDFGKDMKKFENHKKGMKGQKSAPSTDESAASGQVQ